MNMISSAEAYRDEVRAETYRKIKERYGSGHKIAHAFGVKFQAVYAWKGAIPWSRMNQAVRLLND